MSHLPPKILARIENNHVIDCPVDEDFVNQRDNPTDVYIPVLPATIPAFNALTEKIVTTYTYLVTHVATRHKVTPRTIEELLQDVRDCGTLDENQTLQLNISDVPQNLVMAVAQAATNKIQERLDEFANTRGYDNIGSACTYFNSTIPKFQTEGQYCIELRDSTWTALYQYLDDVQQSVVPVPQHWSDIEAVLPTPAWPV